MTCAARYHGDEHAYSNARCRCPEAREAWRLYMKRRREGRQPPGYADPLATSRRLRALATQGWTWEAIAEVDGRPRHSISTLAYVRTRQVRATTVTRIENLYDKLRHIQGPSRLAAIIAARYGWPDPAFWDDYDITDPNVADCKPDQQPDEVLVARFITHATRRGEPGEYRPDLRLESIERDVDQIAVVAELARRGLSDKVIASRLRANPSKVRRLRAVAA